MKCSSVYLVILNCNNNGVLPALCKSLIESDIDSFYHRIVFVDQGSTDGSLEYLKDFCDRFQETTRLVELNKNIGTTKAWNLALQQILYGIEIPKYICLINSDMKVSENFLAPMIKVMEDNPKCGMVSNTLRDYNDINYMQNGGPDINNPWHYRMGFVNQKHFAMNLAPEKAEWGHMGCTLFRSELFKKIGLFDENMFIYSSDFDIQFRLKLAGYEIWFCPKSYAQHKTFVTCNEVKKNPVIEEICKKDGDYLKWKWGEKVIEWFNTSKEAYDINKNLKAIYGENFTYEVNS